jgi:hypothetical protein
MRILGAISVGFLLAGSLAAQRGGEPVVRGTAGSVVYPAGTSALPGVTRTTPSVVHPGGGGVHLVGPGQNNRRGQGAYVPGVVVYPIYAGAYYDSSYVAAQAPPDNQQQLQQPNVTIVMPEQQTANPVIIDNFYPGASTDNPNAAPAAQPAVDEPAPASQPSTYLIAYKDHTIYAAVAYWVDGDMLHYFTAGNIQNQVSLSLIDRDLTARLNREAGVEVKLPAPSK